MATKQPATPQKKQSILKREITIGGVTLTQKALFAKHMAVMLRAGLTVNDALKISHEQAKGKFRRILERLVVSVESGSPLSEAFMQYPGVFSGLFVNVTQAGEKSGNLDQTFENVAEQLEKENELRQKVKGAMYYPIIILIASGLLGLGMAFFVLPKITPLFQGLNIELPVTTRILIWTSSLIRDNGFILFAWVIAVATFLAWLFRQKFMHPFTHWLLLHMPVVKTISRNANLARFCRTLGMLLRSGLVIEDAVAITKDTVENFYYRRTLGKVNERVTKGAQLSDILKEYEKYFPVLVRQMINVGENSGKLDDTLLYLAYFYEIEVDTSTKSLTTALEPVLLLIIGVVVGGLALAIITPIYTITGNIGR